MKMIGHDHFNRKWAFTFNVFQLYKLLHKIIR